jgi:alpha-glucoside transport system ATP-binding protein
VLAKLPGIHTGLRGNTVKLTAKPPKIHIFHEGVSLYYR